MHIPLEVIKVWDKYNFPEKRRRHSLKVAEVALRLAERIKDVNKDLVKTGALLHDIGWAITDDPFWHFIAGAQLLAKEDFAPEIILIVERHFAAGISREEAIRLGLPPKDYLPVSLEEKIVCHADNLTHGDNEISFEEYLQKLDGFAQKNPGLKWLVEKTKLRARRLKEEIEALMNLN